MQITPRDRRAMVILGVVLVVALAAYFLALKPKGGNAAASSPTPAATQTSPSSPFSPKPVSPTPRTTTPPPGAFPQTHDPFSPIVGPSASGGGGGPTGSPSSTTTTTTSPTGTPTGTPTSTPTTTVSPPASPPATPEGRTSTQVGGHTVTLVDVFTQGGQKKAQIRVDSDVFTVSVGQTFDTDFKLVGIQGTCATMTFDTQQFTLCENPQK